VDALEKKWWDTFIVNLGEWYDSLLDDFSFMSQKVMKDIAEDAGISFEEVFYYGVGEIVLRLISEESDLVFKDSRCPEVFRNEKFIEELKFHLRLLREYIESALESAFLKAEIEKIEKYV